MARLFLAFFVATALGATSTAALAGPREQAWRIHSRLAGVPPTEQTLEQMTQLIRDGKVVDAARLAIESPSFYNVTLKTWIAPWTNIDLSPLVELNDFTATAIGIIRDDLPFSAILQGDVLYTGKAELANIPAYSKDSNSHYQALENNGIDLKANLVSTQQSTLTGITDTAGVLTTRAFGAAFLSAGTNRRAIRFTMMNFLCHDMEQLSDTTRPDFHIRRDIPRAPGGEVSAFRNKCAGCHAGMDALGGAFAYFDYRDNQVVYQPGVVQFKMNKNGNEFPDGWVTVDDSWFNNWMEGSNARLGWPSKLSSGQGARSFGQMVAGTEQFSTCMASKVFKQVCLREGSGADDQQVIKKLAASFSADGKLSMKDLFARTAVECVRE